MRRFSNQPTGIRKGEGLRDRTQLMRNKRAASPLMPQISLKSKIGQFRQRFGI